MKLWLPLEVINASEKQVRDGAVDCGTCPVSITCAANQGGNGWKFACCNSTAIEITHTLLVIDCANNTFAQRDVAKDIKQCPLCSSDFVDAAVRGMSETHLYVRTVHSSVPIKERLADWRKRLPIAKAIVLEEQKRLKTS